MADDPFAEQPPLPPWAKQVVWFLDPGANQWAAPSGDQMPDEVWDRLATALHAEAAERSARTTARRARRPRPAWVIGSVAAGVTLLAGGIVVQSVQSTQVAPIAASGATPQPPAEARNAVAAAAQEALADAPLVVSADAPARQVLASGTDYQPQTLRSQVVDLLASIGARDPGSVNQVGQDDTPTTGVNGFTASLSGLRDCITGLTDSAQAQALVVDRALFAGADAGVVVVPDGFAPVSPVLAGQSPSATIASADGVMDVWVVGPDCSRVDPSILLHVFHQFSGQ